LIVENNGIDISIIVPVYGVEKYIDKFMKSLCAQTYQAYRVIFVNDCSKDNSISIIRKYKDFFNERMIIIENKNNLGLSGTRNVGLDYVRENLTDYISFLDPDDYIDPEYLIDMMATAKRYSSDLCISGVVRFDDETGKTICEEMINYSDQVYTNGYNCDEFAYINPCAYSKIYKFDLIKDIRFREIKRSEDTCYLFEILPYLHNIKFTNNAHYHYRVRRSSLSGALDREKYDSMHDEFSKMYNMFEDELYTPYKEMFETQMFIRSSIGGVSRLAFRNLDDSKSIVKEEREFLYKRISNWNKNSYLRISAKSMKSIKRMAVCVCAYMYKLRIFNLFIYIYYFLVNVVKKDVRA